MSARARGIVEETAVSRIQFAASARNSVGSTRANIAACCWKKEGFEAEEGGGGRGGFS
jgi:hypothetical protein